MFPGEAVSGRFLIQEEAASGGMATVYRAWDQARGAAVALKVLHGHGRTDIERLAREAELLAELAHPGIVKYVAHGTTALGAPYLAMEWLEGETLGQRFLSMRHTGERMSVDESVRLSRAIADALGVAHRRSVVHRDVKPGNIFLTDGDVARAKIVDFGIARHTRHVRELTQTGALVGTPGYMAPEQARGSDDIDPRADVFALGCVLHECLTGTPAFVGEQMIGLLAKILLDEVPRVRETVPEAPARLDWLVARMLAKDPDDRPRDANAVVDELDGITGAGGETTIPVEKRRRALGTSEQRILCVLLAQDALPREVEGELPTVRLRDLPPAEAALRAAVAPFGGRLEPVVDGSVVITVAGTQAATDQAAQAARSALALRELLPDSPIALATGRAVVQGRLPFGEVIDGAVRLLAVPSDRRPAIHVDDTTCGLLGNRFNLGGEEGALVLCGELEEETTRTLLGKPTPFVGRDRELDRLCDIFRECVAEPVARAVLVTAPAGAGKSRLRYELVRRIRERHPDVEVLVGRGESVAAGAPFGMLAPAIRRLAGVVDGEPLGLRRRRLRARLARHLDAARAGWVCDFLGEMVGVRFPDDGHEHLRAARRDPKLMGDAMRSAWQEWLAAECGTQPLLVVLEDLHWGDLPSVKLIDVALRNLAERPLMVLALARPDVHAQFPHLWAERPLDELRLAPLGRKAAERLVHETLGPQAPASTVSSVIELADGNPFYLEELIRGVAAGTPSLPVTVLGMVQSRLDTLPDDSRRVLRAAAVFGERFWKGGVAALLGGGELEERLDELVERELIVRRAAATLPGERELTFRHALVREAAYASLTAADRALGHRLAGAWLEKAAGEGSRRAFAMALAQHYDLGAEPEKARGWYRRGAEQALEGNDLASAIARAGRAIACGADGETLGALKLILAEAQAWRGERGEAARCAELAAELLPPGTPHWFRAVAEAIEARCVTGDTDRAEALARAASEAAPAGEGDEHAEQTACLSRAALVLLFAGRSAIVRQLGKQIAIIAGDGVVGLDRRVVGRIRELRALEAYYAGDAEGNLVLLEAAQAAYDSAADARSACQAEAYIGFAYVELGCWEAAEESLARAKEQAERLGLSHVVAVTLKNLGLVAAARGALAEARGLEQRAAELFGQLGVPRMEGAARRSLSALARMAGDAVAAEVEARRAIELLAAAPPKLIGARATLSRALLAQGRVVEALDEARAAMAMFDDLGLADECHAVVPLAYAEALAAAGRPDEAARVALGAREVLLERAGRITDATLRERFLGEVADNLRTLEMARAYLRARGERAMMG